MRKNSHFVLGAVAGICLTLLASGPKAASGRGSQGCASADTYSQLNLFGDVFERVRADYVEKPDDAKLIEGAINGMVTSLDPHSRYMNEWPGTTCRRHARRIRRARHRGHDGRRPRQGGAPMDDTPAAKAGIMSGDLITEIDDDAVQGLTLEQAVNKMKGPVNTKTS